MEKDRGDRARGFENEHYRTQASGREIARKGSVFACALMFRQCAWPAKRRARKKHWRARENAARRNGNWRLEAGDLRLTRFVRIPGNFRWERMLFKNGKVSEPDGLQGLKNLRGNSIFDRPAAEAGLILRALRHG